MHTPEPWSATGIDIEAGGEYIADFSCPELTAEAEAGNAARAVACVNACVGIEDPGTTIPKLIAALRSLVKRADTSELADGSSLDTLEAHVALGLAGIE